MENKDGQIKQKFKIQNTKFIFPVFRKNKSMSLIFEKKKDNIAFDKNLVKVKLLNFCEKEKKNDSEKKGKKYVIQTRNIKLNHSTLFGIIKPEFLIKNFYSSNKNIKNNGKIIGNRILFKNQILREAIYKKGNKIYCEKETNTERLSKEDFINSYFDDKCKFSQIQKRIHNLKLSKFKNIRVTDNLSLTFFYTPK